MKQNQQNQKNQWTSRRPYTKNRVSQKSHHLSRKLATIALAGCATFGVVLPNAGAAFASSSDMRIGPVLVNNQSWRNVPYVQVGNTTFFGIWYLQQLLQSYGIYSKWDGKTLNLDTLPTVQPASTLTVNGVAQKSGTSVLTYNNTSYVNVSALMSAVGGDASFQSGIQSLRLTLPTSNQQPIAAVTVQAPSSAAGKALFASAKPSQTSVTTLGYVRENGHLWRSVPIVRRNGTTFFGVWYLQQFLKTHGIDSNWDAKELSITSLPKVVNGASLTLSGATKKGTLIQWGGNWYASVPTLASLGVAVKENTQSHAISATISSSASISVKGQVLATDGKPIQGQVALQDSTGLIQVVDTDASGSFQAMMNSLGGTLIGINTPTGGWTGQAVTFSGSQNALVATDQQAMTTIQGRLSFAGTRYNVSEVSVRNQITHAHYYATVKPDGTFAMTVPVGGYEAYAAVTDTDAVFLAQPFMAYTNTANVTVSLPALAEVGQKVETAHAIVDTTDSAVSPEQLVSVSNLFEHIYGQDVTRLQLKPTEKMHITLYGTQDSYEQHFIDEGYSTDEAQQIGDGSVGSEEGTNVISVLMPSYEQVDGMNILAHEFTHALVATVSNGIDSWANEGIAWTNGIEGELDGSPDDTLKQGLQWYEWSDIVAHQQAGDLLPLGEDNPLDGTYNIEDQDYYAIHQLITKFGMAKFMQYVKAIDSDDNAFVDTFGETFAQFSNEVTADLQNTANQVNTSFNVKLKVLPGGASQMYVINPLGQTVLIRGLQPGGVYDIVCGDDGTVTLPPGLTQEVMATPDILYSGDWYIGTGTDDNLARQEFEVAYQFGIPYLVQAILYSENGQIDHAYSATAVPNGIQLIGLTPNAGQ